MASARRTAAQGGKAKPAAKKSAGQKQQGGKASPRPHKPAKGGSIPPAATTQPKKRKAGVAQSVEPVRKPAVAGSSPAPRSTKKPKPKPAPSPAKTAAALIAGKAAPGPDRPLTPEHEAFITEYLRNGRNGTAAYLAVYPNSSPAAAAVSAWHLLRIPKIAARIKAEVDRLVTKHVMSREDLMADLVAIVRADPADLMQMRHVSCDECWPKPAVPGPMGNWTEPNPECLHCGGQGILKPWFADTRKLSPGSKALFAGVKVTKNGMEILTESKSSARDQLARIIGAYEKDNDQKGKAAADALREFFGHLHAGAGRVSVVKRPGTPPGNPLVKG